MDADFEAAVQRELQKLREIAGFKAPAPAAPAKILTAAPPTSLPSQLAPQVQPRMPAPYPPSPGPMPAPRPAPRDEDFYSASSQQALQPAPATTASRFSAWDGPSAGPSAAMGVAMPEPSLLAPSSSSSFNPALYPPASSSSSSGAYPQAPAMPARTQPEPAAAPRYYDDEASGGGGSGANDDHASPFEFGASVGSRKGIGYGPTLRKAAPLPSQVQSAVANGPSSASSGPASRRYALSELPDNDDGIFLPPSAARALEGADEKAARQSKQASYAAALERQQREREARLEAEQQQARGRSLGRGGVLASLDGGDSEHDNQGRRYQQQQQQQQQMQQQQMQQQQMQQQQMQQARGRSQPPAGVDAPVRIVGGKIKPVLPAQSQQQPTPQGAPMPQAMPATTSGGSGSGSGYYAPSGSSSSGGDYHQQPPPSEYDERRYYGGSSNTALPSANAAGLAFEDAYQKRQLMQQYQQHQQQQQQQQQQHMYPPQPQLAQEPPYYQPPWEVERQQAQAQAAAAARPASGAATSGSGSSSGSGFMIKGGKVVPRPAHLSKLVPRGADAAEALAIMDERIISSSSSALPGEAIGFGAAARPPSPIRVGGSAAGAGASAGASSSSLSPRSPRLGVGPASAQPTMPANADYETVKRAMEAGHTFTRFRRDPNALSPEERARAEAKARERERHAMELAAQVEERQRAKAEQEALEKRLEEEEEKRLQADRQQTQQQGGGITNTGGRRTQHQMQLHIQQQGEVLDIDSIVVGGAAQREKGRLIQQQQQQQQQQLGGSGFVSYSDDAPDSGSSSSSSSGDAGAVAGSSSPVLSEVQERRKRAEAAAAEARRQQLQQQSGLPPAGPPGMPLKRSPLQASPRPLHRSSDGYDGADDNGNDDDDKDSLSKFMTGKGGHDPLSGKYNMLPQQPGQSFLRSSSASSASSQLSSSLLAGLPMPGLPSSVAEFGDKEAVMQYMRQAILHMQNNSGSATSGGGNSSRAKMVRAGQQAMQGLHGSLHLQQLESLLSRGGGGDGSASSVGAAEEWQSVDGGYGHGYDDDEGDEDGQGMGGRGRSNARRSQSASLSSPPRRHLPNGPQYHHPSQQYVRSSASVGSLPDGDEHHGRSNGRGFYSTPPRGRAHESHNQAMDYSAVDQSFANTTLQGGYPPSFGASFKPLQLPFSRPAVAAAGGLDRPVTGLGYSNDVPGPALQPASGSGSGSSVDDDPSLNWVGQARPLTGARRSGANGGVGPALTVSPLNYQSSSTYQDKGHGSGSLNTSASSSHVGLRPGTGGTHSAAVIEQSLDSETLLVYLGLQQAKAKGAGNSSDSPAAPADASPLTMLPRASRLYDGEEGGTLDATSKLVPAPEATLVLQAANAVLGTAGGIDGTASSPYLLKGSNADLYPGNHMRSPLSTRPTQQAAQVLAAAGIRTTASPSNPRPAMGSSLSSSSSAGSNEASTAAVAAAAAAAATAAVQAGLGIAFGAQNAAAAAAASPNPSSSSSSSLPPARYLTDYLATSASPRQPQASSSVQPSSSAAASPTAASATTYKLGRKDITASAAVFSSPPSAADDLVDRLLQRARHETATIDKDKDKDNEAEEGERIRLPLPSSAVTSAAAVHSPPLSPEEEEKIRAATKLAAEIQNETMPARAARLFGSPSTTTSPLASPSSGAAATARVDHETKAVSRPSSAAGAGAPIAAQAVPELMVSAIALQPHPHPEPAAVSLPGAHSSRPSSRASRTAASAAAGAGMHASSRPSSRPTSAAGLSTAAAAPAPAESPAPAQAPASSRPSSRPTTAAGGAPADVPVNSVAEDAAVGLSAASVAPDAKPQTADAPPAPASSASVDIDIDMAEIEQALSGGLGSGANSLESTMLSAAPAPAAPASPAPEAAPQAEPAAPASSSSSRSRPSTAAGQAVATAPTSQQEPQATPVKSASSRPPSATVAAAAPATRPATATAAAPGAEAVAAAVPASSSRPPTAPRARTPQTAAATPALPVSESPSGTNGNGSGGKDKDNGNSSRANTNASTGSQDYVAQLAKATAAFNSSEGAGSPAGLGSSTGSLEGSGRFQRRESWGLNEEGVSLHKRRLMAFYSVHAPAKAHGDNVNAAWQLFGTRIWDELRRKYGEGKVAGFVPSGTDLAASASASPSPSGGAAAAGSTSRRASESKPEAQASSSGGIVVEAPAEEAVAQ